MGATSYEANQVLVEVADDSVRVKVELKVNRQLPERRARVQIKGERHLQVSMESDGNQLTIKCASLPPRRVSVRGTGAATVVGDGTANTGFMVGSRPPKRRDLPPKFMEVTRNLRLVERRPFKCTITIEVPPGALFALET